MYILLEDMASFRVPFFEGLKTYLNAYGVDLRVGYAPNQRNNFVRGVLPWGEAIPIKRFGPFVWQKAIRHVWRNSLVIVPQANRYLITPVLLLARIVGGPHVAFWGHGKTFQKPRIPVISIGLKRVLAKRVDWWFAYNRMTAEIIETLGYPSARITVVQNTIDVKQMQKARRQVSDEDLLTLRSELGLSGDNIVIYTGGLYHEKRIAFLIEAAAIVRANVPDFSLIILGNGPDATLVEQAASTYPWVRYLGAKGDIEKIPYWALAKLVLMPGLVGLVVVDSFALGVPLVTTDYPYHSPEIDYLESGRNGLIVNCGEDRMAYAIAIVHLLDDAQALLRLRDGALATAEELTMESMVKNYADGVLRALGEHHETST